MPPHFDDRIAEGPFKPLYSFYARLIIERTGKVSGTLLDVGCGGGHLGFALMQLGDFKVTFVDVDPEAMAATRVRATSLGLENRCTFLVCSVEDLSVQSDSVDLVVSRSSMPFWEDQHQAIRELTRVLKEGGLAYIGGGMGPRRLKAQVLEKMKAFGVQRRRHHNRKTPKILNDSDYTMLLRELGCRAIVIRNKNEGYWLVFTKPIPRELSHGVSAQESTQALFQDMNAQETVRT